MISVNREAMKTVRLILDEADALGVAVSRLANGATVIDMGLEAKGGWRAAQLYTLASLGGLGIVSYEPFDLAGRMLTAVRVMIDHPIEACVASQIAGWRLQAPGTEHAAILAGPGRALNREDLDHYFEWIDYRDDHHEFRGGHPDLGTAPDRDGRHDRVGVPGRSWRPVRAVRPQPQPRDRGAGGGPHCGAVHPPAG